MRACLVCGWHAALTPEQVVYVCAAVAVAGVVFGVAWWAWDASRGWREGGEQ